MLGLPILYLKGMRLMMFQLSGFCCIIYSEFQKVFGHEDIDVPTFWILL